MHYQWSTGFMNKITGLGNTKLSVAYAFHIGNNAILDEFTDYVKASTFNTDVPSVCAFRVNGVTKEDANWELGAILPAISTAAS
ncbi:uncharacterized protein N7484_007058 [Penicillium longicatenatum]|uniref:uncharacterized protein n=1 Tax=Penicillium longicatenatum TaxID=1561947 RepID=UPI00254672B3|nr:uncharacterized protein N7484_007058 [Penicillium longicatenatum]KAJ5639196.1 hypothetical protein N7484_007058 [Penicillium longicatenatum]